MSRVAEVSYLSSRLKPRLGGMPRFAHVDISGPEDVCLVTELGIGGQLRGEDALEVAVSRVIEQRIASAEGLGLVRKWLTIIGMPSLPAPPHQYLLDPLLWARLKLQSSRPFLLPKPLPIYQSPLCPCACMLVRRKQRRCLHISLRRDWARSV